MKRLALIPLFILLCGIAGTSARHAESTSSARHKATTTALTANDCFLYAKDGKVFVCHATQSATNPYVLLHVSLSACVNGHEDHPDDFAISAEAEELNCEQQ